MLLIKNYSCLSCLLIKFEVRICRTKRLISFLTKINSASVKFCIKNNVHKSQDKTSEMDNLSENEK